jgi:hypothetical protein
MHTSPGPSAIETQIWPSGHIGFRGPQGISQLENIMPSLQPAKPQ